MCRSAYRHANTSHPETENLRTDDPGQTGVGKAEAHSEDVDEGDGGIASGTQCTAFARTGDLDVCSDEPLRRYWLARATGEMVCVSAYHRDQHDHSTSHQHISPAIAVNDKVHGDDHTHQPDNAVNTGGIQTGRGSGKTDRFEDPWRIVVDRVGSGELHEDEDHHSDEDASAVAGTAKFLPLGKHAATGAVFTVIVDGRHDVGKLFLKVRVIF